MAEEPLICAILDTSTTFSRSHAMLLLKRWFCISLRNSIAVEGLASRTFEGVVLDTQTEGMNESEAATWADDDAVVNWIMQFTGHGSAGNIFQQELDVSPPASCRCYAPLVYPNCMIERDFYCDAAP